VCSLTSLILFEDRNYEALSYTWGSHDDLRAISLSGKMYSVGVNLESALLHLRKHDVVRRLWVDALCINQADNDEKHHQVDLMRLIYQQASGVLVWLGPAADDSDLAMEYLEEKATELKCVRPGETFPIGSVKREDLPAIYRLLQNPYWNRLWVIQEVSVASTEPLVGFGQKWLPWST
jgi:hypothetical protein